MTNELATTVASASLNKPDMNAVLKRTNITKNLNGFLLPVFEAVSNAIHGIEARFKEEAHVKGMIQILILNSNNPIKINISIIDNGIGMNEENFNSFTTPYSGYKLNKNGRGFGRFIAFKIFNKIKYSSNFEFMNSKSHRAFNFDLSEKDELTFINEMKSFNEVGLRVEYRNPLTNWHEMIKKITHADIANSIASHFLPYFLNNKLPEIMVVFDEGEPENLTLRLKNILDTYEDGVVEINSEGSIFKLNYKLSKIQSSKQFNHHCLIFTASNRMIGNSKDLSNLIGNSYFTDENNSKYIIIATVSGEFLDSHTNDSRTYLDISANTIDKITVEISNKIQKSEKEQIKKIKIIQENDLNEALGLNPILRLGLKGKNISDYVASKPNNWTNEEFVSDLSINKFRESKNLSQQLLFAASSPEGYISSIKEIVSKIDKNNKEALAEYIVHRKKVIELVEMARRYSSSDKHHPEEIIHDLIFKRFSDNSSTNYFEHNLWLIDDALAFLPHITSDRTPSGGSRKKGDKVTDLAFFDEPVVLGDNDGTTISIVEFKKPSRNDYSFGSTKNDPVTQVIDTLEYLTKEGGITKLDGTHMSFQSVIRRFAFIIADHTPSLVNVFNRHDFSKNQNPKIYFRHRDHEKIFIQAMGYDTLIENAKKRNQAFEKVLFG